MKKVVKVAGAIIENEKHQILCALRSLNMSNSNLWEFPGGKIEDGENLQNTIIREIKEELDCDIEPSLEIFDDYSHESEKVIIRLITLKCKIKTGEPKPKEHAKIIWLDKENLNSLKWSPADIPTVEKLVNSCSK